MKPVLLYDNRFLDGTPTACSTDAASDYDILNIKDWRPYTLWKAANTTTPCYITVDCGLAKAADALGILRHNFGTIGADISVECSSDNFGADITVALAPFSPADDYLIFKTFSTQTKQHWRLKIDGAVSAAPKIGVLVTGVKFLFERYLKSPFDPQPEKLINSSKVSNEGHILGVTKRFIEYMIQPRFTRLTPSWVKNTFRPIWDAHLSDGKPFFWAWELDNYSDEVYYVALKDKFQLKMPYDPVRRSLALDMRGVKE